MTDQPLDDTTISLDPEALESGSGDLAHLLAEEFRRDAVTADERNRLREALMGDQPTEELGELQRQLSTIEAYVDALDPILPNGEEPNEAVQALVDQVADLESTLTDTVGELDERAETRSDVETSVDEVRSVLGDTADRCDDLEADLARLDAAIADLESTLERLEDLDERTAELDDEFDRALDRCEDLKAFTDEVSSALDGIGQ